MIKEQSQKLIKEFIANTSAEGLLVTDENGERLYHTTSTLKEIDLDEIAAIASVSDSMYSRINNKLHIDNKEFTLIVNKSDYIVIKQLHNSSVFLSQIKRSVDINLIYNEVNKLAEELLKV